MRLQLQASGWHSRGHAMAGDAASERLRKLRLCEEGVHAQEKTSTEHWTSGTCGLNGKEEEERDRGTK